MAKLKREDTQRLSLTLSNKMVARIKRLSLETGQTYSSVAQMCIAMGLGALEPAVLGSISASVDNNKNMNEYLQSPEFISGVLKQLEGKIENE